MIAERSVESETRLEPRARLRTVATRCRDAPQQALGAGCTPRVAGRFKQGEARARMRGSKLRIALLVQHDRQVHQHQRLPEWMVLLAKRVEGGGVELPGTLQVAAPPSDGRLEVEHDAAQERVAELVGELSGFLDQRLSSRVVALAIGHLARGSQRICAC